MTSKSQMKRLEAEMHNEREKILGSTYKVTITMIIPSIVEVEVKDEASGKTYTVGKQHYEKTVMVFDRTYPPAINQFGFAQLQGNDGEIVQFPASQIVHMTLQENRVSSLVN